MSSSLIWISGASSGIGRAMVETVPWEGARVIGISRRAAPGVEHLQADLADPSSWVSVGESFRRELDHFDGDRVAFVHAAGMVEPIGFAGEVDTATYTANVLLNSASPQVLGHLFLAAAREVAASRHLIMLTSGAASSVYAGWTAYGAGKAAVDQWVRNAGAEQSVRGGVQVLAVGPGTVDTAMQEQFRAASEEAFPKRQKFLDLHKEGKLSDPSEVATAIWDLLDQDLDNGSVVDLRELTKIGG
ncbi:MAG: SDR family NAD(P)-dependent oxidoreductase [Actinomycetota bacterium]|nr:SDR family NAD(P)-dependent oxidoreductase [Actinomycetota bacterium]